VAVDEFGVFRQWIDDLLRAVQRYAEANEGPRKLGEPTSKTPQLSPGDCERIRFAIKNRHDPDSVGEQSWGTGLAEQLGHEFVDQLAEADRDLTPDQVNELVARALAGIPERP
jgi:hypothetical protein